MEGTLATEQKPPAERKPRSKREVAQARRRRNRLLPLLVLALVSFITGVVVASGSPERDAASRFINAWTKQDFAAMYKELSSTAAAQYPLQDFGGAYVGAQRTATATAIDPGSISGPSDINGHKTVTVAIKIRTRLFGLVGGTIQLPFDGNKIAWAPHLTFPGLNEGERLARHLTLSTRAPIVAKNGTTLAAGQGAARTSSLGTAATDITGTLGRANTDQIGQLQAAGYPSDVEVGTSGLERAYNSRLAGTPGGQLLAVTGSAGGDVPASTQGRVLATAQAKPGQPLHTTIDPRSSRRRAVTARSAGRPGASRSSTPRTARSGRWPARPTRSPRLQARPSR